MIYDMIVIGAGASRHDSGCLCSRSEYDFR